MYGRAFYDAVADALMGFLPPSFRDFGWYRTGHNIKVWYGDDGKEHYEVQILKVNKKIVLEIGFHAEHGEVKRNEDAIERLSGVETKWRRALGEQPEVGSFLGVRSRPWKRISETWEGNGDPELAIDAAERLAEYIKTLEPLRRRRAVRQARRPAASQGS